MVCHLHQRPPSISDKTKGIHQERISSHVRAIKLPEHGLRFQISVLNLRRQEEIENLNFNTNEKSAAAVELW